VTHPILVPVLKYFAFFHKFLQVAGVRIGALILSFTINVLLARNLGPSEYGLYAFAIALFTIIQPVAGGGLGTLAVREFPRNDDTVASKRELAGRYVAISFFLSAIIGCIVALVCYFFDIESSATLRLALLILPALVILETLRGVLVGQHRITTGQLLKELLRPGLFLASLSILFLLQKTEKSAYVALIVFGLTCWATVLVALYVNKISLRNLISFSAFRQTVMGTLRRSLPFAVISSMQFFNTRVDILFIGNLLTAEDVGFYQVAVKLSDFILLPASLVALLLAPRYSAAYKNEKRTQLRHLHTAGQIAGIAMALPIFVLCFWAGQSIIVLIFGKGYSMAVTPLLILASAKMILSARMASTMLLSMTKFEGKVMQAMLVGLVGNIILNAILVPRYGINGAASATAFMGLITFLMLSVSLYQSGVISRSSSK